ncbi:MAG: hypothetical protein AAF585_17455, partial [Verrucomicrobiota bacterium]
MGRRTDSGVQVSLFPFLSILAALIGTLVVIIAAMAIAQLGKAEAKEPEEVDRAKENKIVLKRIEEISKEAVVLRDIMNKITALNQNNLSLQKRRDFLKDLEENADKREENREQLRAQLAQLIKDNKNLDTDINTLVMQIEELLKQIENRKKKPEKPPVRIQPGGSARGKKASFVEISNKVVIIHRKGHEPKRIPVATLDTDPEFRKLLQHVDAQPYRTLTFLIRGTPESMATYNKANGIVAAFAASESKRDNFRAGRLPIAGEGRIDL